MEKIYHIYVKGRCVYHSLNEEDFKEKWETLRNLVELLDTGHDKDDISYEELVVNKKVVLESSH